MIYANDLSFTPRTIRVKKGMRVQVLFIVDRKDTYYGGLDIRSDTFRTGTIAPGQRQTVEFTADESFSFQSFWPSTSALKATGRVEVVE